MVDEIDAQQSHQPAEDRLVDALAQTAFATVAALNRVGAEHDLSLTQLRVLGILRDRQIRIGTLADHLGLERSTTTGLVDRAERRGLVRRVPGSTDGRSVEVSLSADGAALAVRLEDAIRRSLAPLTTRLGPSDRRRLQQLLERMLGTGPRLSDPGGRVGS
jgi:DNA-binding MarR family transcriptional regulator